MQRSAMQHLQSTRSRTPSFAYRSLPLHRSADSQTFWLQVCPEARSQHPQRWFQLQQSAADAKHVLTVDGRRRELR